MTYQSDKMQLNSIQTLLISETNDIFVCVDEKSSTKDRYVVLVLKSHDIIRKFIEICAKDEMDEDSFTVSRFSDMGRYILVFPYLKRRPLNDFYVGEAMSLAQCEDVCSNLVLSCIQSGIPYALLYLILKQGQLNLNRDYSVYITYELDLNELDVTKTEKDCVVECARILLSLYESKQNQKAISYTLLEKKIRSYGYTKFAELYKDITISASPRYRINIAVRLKAFWTRIKDNVFQVILVLCVILIIAAAASLVSQILFGNVPWLSVFINNFKQIGTESLIQ